MCSHRSFFSPFVARQQNGNEILTLMQAISYRLTGKVRCHRVSYSGVHQRQLNVLHCSSTGCFSLSLTNFSVKGIVLTNKGWSVWHTGGRSGNITISATHLTATQSINRMLPSRLSRKSEFSSGKKKQKKTSQLRFPTWKVKATPWAQS